MKVRESTGEIIFKYSVGKIIAFDAIGLNRQKTKVLLGGRDNNDNPIIVYFDSETGETGAQFKIKDSTDVYHKFIVVCLLGEQNKIYYFLGPDRNLNNDTERRNARYYGILDGSAPELA